MQVSGLPLLMFHTKKGGGDSLVATIPAAVYDTLKPYTLLLYSDVDGKGRATRISDDVTNVNADKMNFRFWHLAYDAEDVDFYHRYHKSGCRPLPRR